MASRAAPLADRYAGWFERHPRDEAPPMESAPIAVARARGPGAPAHRSRDLIGAIQIERMKPPSTGIIAPVMYDAGRGEQEGGHSSELLGLAVPA